MLKMLEMLMFFGENLRFLENVGKTARFLASKWFTSVNVEIPRFSKNVEILTEMCVITK